MFPGPPVPCERETSVGLAARQRLDRCDIRAGEHRLGHPAAEAGSRERAELARMVRASSPEWPEPAPPGKDTGRREIGVGRPRPADPTRHRPHRRPALPSPPAGPASRASTRRGDAMTAPARRRKPRRRAAPIPGNARRARRSALPPSAQLREHAGAPVASAPAADSRPNWHSARDSGGPTARGHRVLLHYPPP